MSYLEASRTTLKEFQTYNLAYAIKQEDARHNAAIQAWFNQTVKATKGSGKSTKSAYKNFKDFYDHEKEFNNILSPNIEKKKLTLADKNRLINKRIKEGTNGS